MGQDYTPHPYQKMIYDYILENQRCAIWAGMGMGKLQHNAEPVLTPTGWCPIGSLREGDKVFGADGRETHVTGVFPQGEKEIFKVEFNDGSWTRAGAEHLWRVFTARDRHAGREGCVLTTAQIIEGGLRDINGNSRWFIPLVAPIEHVHKDFLVEPYLLGVILGDGHIDKSGAVSVTTDEDIVRCWAGSTQPHPSKGIVNKSLSGLLPAMRALRLNGCRSWEKFCPGEYLFGAVGQRLALLQGLLDTDGHAIHTGGVEFSTTADALADAVVSLAQSLGGVARKSKPRRTSHQNGLGRVSWRVNVKLPANFEPFRLPRKLAAWVRPTKYRPTRAIRSITPDGIGLATCIAVAAPDKLYITRHHIVTHNTSSALTAISDLHLIEGGPTLVIAPLRVARSTWPAEVAKWRHLNHLRVMPVVGSEKERISALRTEADVYTTNYDNLVWLTDRLGEDWPFRSVVADESTRLKSFRLRQGGARAQALGKVAHTKIKRFVELTGTPAPNGLIDLWGQAWFLDAGKRLGRTFTSFKERWFQTSFDGYGTTPMGHAQGEIHTALRDLCLTVDAKDWFDLKDPIVNNIFVDLPVRARALYKDMEKEMFMQIDEHDVEAFNAAAKTQKLLQLASGAVYIDPTADSDYHPRSKEWRKVHDVKLEALEEIIDEAAGAPVLVAYHFRSDLERLKKHFPKGRELDKHTSTIDAWNAGRVPILFAHPQSAGHGLNLQDGGNILVFFSHNWKLEDRLQIVERIGPMRQMQAGHERPVFIHNIIARDTMDELVIERVKSKREVQDILLEAMRRRS